MPSSRKSRSPPAFRVPVGPRRARAATALVVVGRRSAHPSPRSSPCRRTRRPSPAWPRRPAAARLAIQAVLVTVRPLGNRAAALEQGLAAPLAKPAAVRPRATVAAGARHRRVLDCAPRGAVRDLARCCGGVRCRRTVADGAHGGAALPIGAWVRLMERIPVLVRFAVGIVAVYFVSERFLPERVRTAENFRPQLVFLLIGVAVFAVLIPSVPAARAARRPRCRRGGTGMTRRAVWWPSSRSRWSRGSPRAGVAFADNCGDPRECYATDSAATRAGQASWRSSCCTCCCNCSGTARARAGDGRAVGATASGAKAAKAAAGSTRSQAPAARD